MVQVDVKKAMADWLLCGYLWKSANYYTKTFRLLAENLKYFFGNLNLIRILLMKLFIFCQFLPIVDLIGARGYTRLDAHISALLLSTFEFTDRNFWIESRNLKENKELMKSKFQNRGYPVGLKCKIFTFQCKEWSMCANAKKKNRQKLGFNILS